MAKLKTPLMSFEARGKLADSIVYFPWKGVAAVRQYVIPANPRTTAQTAQRGYLTLAVADWHNNAYTDADVVAWNRYAGVLAAIMSGFNAMMRLAIAERTVGVAWEVASDIQVDTPTVNGFDFNIENSVAGRTYRIKIGTRKTHMPTAVALVDDADGTYSLTWAGGQSGTKYYAQLEWFIDAVWRTQSGIYTITTS